jgi:hypothetical protein
MLITLWSPVDGAGGHWGSGMPRRVACTAGDMPTSYRNFNRFLRAMPERNRTSGCVRFTDFRMSEAASSHGPVDAKRHSELAELFAGSSVGLVFVSCFPDRRDMRKYLADIAWETEVWCADNPTHLIHFNGQRFLGPYGAATDRSGAAS